jgi:hypothetical protein
VVANNAPDGVKAWLNDGNAGFDDSGQTLGETTSYAAGLADLDGDGDLDIFAANFGPDKVYLNDAGGLPSARFDVDRRTNPAGLQVYYWSSSGNATLPILLNRPAIEAVDVHAGIEFSDEVANLIIPFGVGEQLKILNVENPSPDPNEEVHLTLSVTPSGGFPGPGDLTDRLLLVFVAAEQGMAECILCYVEWLSRFLGFNPIFGVMHHLDLPDQESSPLWPYYTALFDIYSPELAGIAASHPSTLWSALSVLDQTTPLVTSLADGSGSEHVLNPQLVDEVVSLLEAVETRAGPGLRAALQQEMNALDLPSLAGLTMDQVWVEVQSRRPVELIFISIVLK